MLDVSPLEKAIGQLKESLDYAHSPLAQRDAGVARQFRASSIQAFECTYELCHKMLKRYLQATDPNPDRIKTLSFQDLIRTGADRGLLLHSLDVWHTYRHYRSLTSHTYDETKADKVFDHIKNFLEDAVFLLQQLNTRLSA